MFLNPSARHTAICLLPLKLFSHHSSLPEVRGTVSLQHPPCIAITLVVHVELKFLRTQKPCRETLKNLHVLVLSAL